jgi:iron complex outermembrane receptor protein
MRLLALASVSLISIAAPAFAADTAPATTDTAASSGDIIVSARRKEERLQDVPKVVNAVSADDLRKNNVQKLEDVASIVPGVSLQNAGNGETQNATMRGANFDVVSGLNPTVQFYLNDANIHQNFVFQSMYDVGSIEVLRGPQGTLRGRSAPSGSITLTTKAPDLYKFGGYIDADGETGIPGHKEDFAVNVPIIEGKLAIRAAAEVSDNDVANIKTVYPTLYSGGSFDRTWSERLSVRAAPTDSVEINLMYQRLVDRVQAYLQTESTCLIDPTVSCGTGPLISQKDRLSTVNGQRKVYQASDVWNGRADWHVLGQKLSYVGSFALEHIIDEEPEDGANYFAGQANPDQKVSGVRSQFQSHEIRLASEERILNIFDYTVGLFTYDTRNNIFGGPGGADPAASATLFSEGFNSGTETSYFGNITAHPTEQLELSGGYRHILYKSIPPAGLPTRDTASVWSASASYHFTPAIMGYVNAGSSWRPDGANLGFQFLPYQVGGVLPGELQLPASVSGALINIQPEKSTSYEVGIKSQFLNRKLTLNLDYYHQDYTNFQYITPDFMTVYLQSTPGYGVPMGIPNQVSPQIVIGTLNVPAKVDGVEGDINYRYAHDGNIGATFSYSNGRVTGGAQVPCSGTVTLAAPVAYCAGGPTSFQPKFGATVHADYAQPINDQVTGFVRGLATIAGASPLNPGNPYDKQKSYALFNLYAGVRAPNSAWEATLFVKNVFNNQTRLATYGGNINAGTAQGGPATGPNGNVSSAYTYVGVTPPREFGVNLRYAFGSR